MKKNNPPKYDPNKTYYIIDIEYLLPSDVILTSNNGLVSKIIANQTNGDFSHAMLVVSNGSVIEATLKGVFSENVTRLLFQEKEYVEILRWKKELTNEQRERIAFYARNLVGSKYSIPQAVLAKFNITDRLNRKQFCSRLVADAYQRENCIIEGISSSDYCNPNDLSRSSSFKKLDNQKILRIASPEEIKFANSDSPILKNLHEMYSWMNKIRNVARKKHSIEIQNESDVTKFICLYPQYDAELQSFLDESGYLI